MAQVAHNRPRLCMVVAADLVEVQVDMVEQLVLNQLALETMVEMADEGHLVLFLLLQV
jgi:hypothetical protein